MTRENNGRPYIWYEIRDLYDAVLNHWYGHANAAKAKPLAFRLLRLLGKHDPNAETLLGMSGRWLAADLDGDTEDAIRYREKELAVLRDQIALGLITKGGLTAEEFSDRLDLLACDYLEVKRYNDALAVLAESEAFCERHGIPFDGKDIRADVKRAMRRKRPRKARSA